MISLQIEKVLYYSEFHLEVILVGRIYEKDQKILKEIKELLPDCYICNLDGKVIVE